MHPKYVVLHEVTWHGAWLHGVHGICQDGSSCMWHHPCYSAASTQHQWIFKTCYKKLVTHLAHCMFTEQLTWLDSPHSWKWPVCSTKHSADNVHSWQCYAPLEPASNGENLLFVSLFLSDAWQCLKKHLKTGWKYNWKILLRKNCTSLGKQIAWRSMTNSKMC